jgi:uncharacterized protein YlzI (FlbEa/FlbD family)
MNFIELLEYDGYTNSKSIMLNINEIATIQKEKDIALITMKNGISYLVWENYNTVISEIKECNS